MLEKQRFGGTTGMAQLGSQKTNSKPGDLPTQIGYNNDTTK